jgi:hypothetical protein
VPRTEKAICAILLGDDPDSLVRELQHQFPKGNLISGDADFELLVAKVVRFVEAPALGLDLHLDVRGTQSPVFTRTTRFFAVASSWGGTVSAAIFQLSRCPIF